MQGLRIEPLERSHVVDSFDCGEEPLNRFLIRFALQNQQARASRTFVAISGGIVIGFYTLVVGEVQYDSAAERLRKGLSRHPVPIMVLARFAVARDWQGRGVGSGLLKDALLRTLQAGEHAGIRAMIVHAKNDVARAFYERHGFAQSPTDPMHLFVLMKDVERELRNG